MIIKEFIEKNLGHVSYLIIDETSKTSVIIDPRRDIEEYTKFIEDNNLKLKYIINTHTHADYIGGHLELKDFFPDSEIIFQNKVPARFPYLKVKEGDRLLLGNIYLKIIETPGHTPYCISILIEEDNIDKFIFTGDFLFIGDIGRPDLLGDEIKNNLIEMSYNSAKKLWNLEDSIIVLPSHIGGSLCGKSLKNQYFSTIGIEKKINRAFKLVENEDFYKNYLKNLQIEIPNYFKKMAKINIEGPTLLKNLQYPKYITYDELLRNYNHENDFIIDVRHPNCFKSAYIKDSINIYEFSNIPLIAGSLINIESGIYLVGSKNSDFFSIIKKLRRVGFDRIKGILKEDVNELEGLQPFKTNDKDVKVIDLDNIIPNSDFKLNISQIKFFNFDKNITYKVFCRNGYKSIAVESFIKKINRRNGDKE